MIFSINNYKNKKRKTVKNIFKNSEKQSKMSYTKLNITKIDKVFQKITKSQPNLFPEYVVYNNKQWLIELSKNIAQKINSQILTYKSQKGRVYVDFLAFDCAYQIFRQKRVNIFDYLQTTYGYDCLNKKEQKIFPYLLSKYILSNIILCMKQLKRFSFEIEYGSIVSKKIANLSVANVYGAVKYNQNFAKIRQNLTLNIEKCIFIFIDKLFKIQHKLNVCVNYLEYIAKKFF